jgi:hypothetical protein
VTGAAGFIGMHVGERLMDEGATTVLFWGKGMWLEGGQGGGNMVSSILGFTRWLASSGVALYNESWRTA